MQTRAARTVSKFIMGLSSETNPTIIKTMATKLMPKYRPYSMLARQKSLPRLPVPPLQQTMDKYLNAIRPLVNDDQFEQTRKLVEEFRKPGGIGQKLQEKLVERSKTEDNWLAQWWDNCAYFDVRMPVTVNVSPGLAFPKQYFSDPLDHLRYSARIISSVLKFRELVDSESLPVDTMGRQPLDMLQYPKLLCSTRIPHPQRDYSYIAPKGESRHIVVAHKNQFYKMVVYGSDGQPLSDGDFVRQLQMIVEDDSPTDQHPVGILTAEDRTFWAKHRKQILKDKHNKEVLEAIEKSVFLLCLDRPPVPSTQAPSVMESPTSSVTARQCVHGDGSQSNSGNRWFDKTCQFLVSEDGHCGLCYEHSAAEGPPVAALLNHVLHHSDGYQKISPSTSTPGLPTPVKLKWNLKPRTVEAIQVAIQSIDSLVNDVDIRCFIYDRYGKGFIKKQRLSPDAYLQIAYQLTFYRLHGHVAPTYETGSTRKFQLGRTDTIRSASIASTDFVKAMVYPGKTNAERLALMRKAIEAHTKYTKEACDGQGIDRHLLGLKLAALESGMHLPDLFMDHSFSYALHFKLSTSQVPSPYDLFLTFGPAVPDGYGICYNPKNDQVIFGVSTWNSNPQTNSGHFSAYLQRSLDDMRLLLTTAKL